MFDRNSEENWWLCYALGGHFAGMVWVHLSLYAIFTLDKLLALGPLSATHYARQRKNKTNRIGKLRKRSTLWKRAVTVFNATQVRANWNRH